MPWPFPPKYPEKNAEFANQKAYDYIVIGGGTSGCVLASRLSSSSQTQVLLLERGPTNDTYISRIPLISANILDPSTGAKSWLCEPMTHCDNRRSLVFRADVMGGASRVNSAVYTRGTKGDYEAWKEMGNEKWGWEDVEPVFKRCEGVVGEDAEELRERGRGTEGPWVMKRFGYLEWPWRVMRVFADAAETMGFSQIYDTNVVDAPIEGVAELYSTVTEVHRIVFRDEHGVPRADKVIFGSSDPTSSKTFEAKIKNEVIICSGALGSPHVLMLSGIGPRKHLEEHNIEVIHDSPGVGSNLTDHPSIPVAWEMPIKESMNQVVVSPLKAALEFGKYLLFGTGIFSFPCQTMSFFVRSESLNEAGTDLKSTPTNPPNSSAPKPQDLTPDIELMPLATSAIDDLEEHIALYSKRGIFSVLATLCNPLSRGSVRLRTRNPHDFPAVDFGIFSHPADMITARRAIRLALSVGKIMHEASFPLLHNLTFPSSKQQLDIESGNTEQIDNFIRHRVRNIFHYSSTCRMGREDDEDAPGVVDQELCVHGVRGVRVADASVFPRIVSHHTMAPAVMVAARCADFLIGGEKDKE